MPYVPCIWVLVQKCPYISLVLEIPRVLLELTKQWSNKSVRPGPADASHLEPKHSSESQNKCAKVAKFISLLLPLIRRSETRMSKLKERMQKTKGMK